MIKRLTACYQVLLAVTERAVSPLGITPQGMNVLLMLQVRAEEGCLLGEIGEHLMVSAATVTGLVDRLVRRGLVSRIEQADDRRKRRVRLTAEGLDFLGGVLPRYAGFFTGALASFDREQKTQLAGLLEGLTTHLLPLWEKKGHPVQVLPCQDPDGAMDA